MLSSGLVAVSLLLATHGDEGSGEEKFRGVLLAQNAASVATVNDTAAIHREIALLTIERPSLMAPIVITVTGGGLALAGGISFLVALGAGGWTAVGLVVLRVIGLVLGGVVAVVGLIALAVTASVREHTDERLLKLNEQLKAAAPAPAANSLAGPPASLLLARF